MRVHQHIINKHIIEAHIPSRTKAPGIQQKLSDLHEHKLLSVIDRSLSERFGNDRYHYQIDSLTVDLGQIEEVGDLEKVFAEKFREAINAASFRKFSSTYEEERDSNGIITPLKVLSYYLMNGILPWWADHSTESAKSYLHQQLSMLLQKPGQTFKVFISQLHDHRQSLKRFLYTFTEKQVLQCLQLLSPFSLERLTTCKQKVESIIADHKSITADHNKTWSHEVWWEAVFNQITRAESYEELEQWSIREVLQRLGFDQTIISQYVSPNKKESETYHSAAQSMVVNFQKRYVDNEAWQHFFSDLSQWLYRSSLRRVSAHLFKELQRSLINLQEAQDRAVKWIDSQKLSEKEKRKKLVEVTKVNLQPVAVQLHQLKTRTTAAVPNLMEKLQSEFEDTDGISVHNAGLVILWPFLQRFFENLGLISDQAFLDETTKNRAVCVLQYLCDTDEEALFEGVLPLNKVMCGVPLEDTIEPVLLSTDEKEFAEGLLHSVISRGPYWKNLTLDGFRTSYLQRHGLLKSRDGHWLLQVEKETFDVTLEKLPWGFSVVKLPWMEAPLMVEWMN